MTNEKYGLNEVVNLINERMNNATAEQQYLLNWQTSKMSYIRICLQQE